MLWLQSFFSHLRYLKSVDPRYNLVPALSQPQFSEGVFIISRIILERIVKRQNVKRILKVGRLFVGGLVRKIYKRGGVSSLSVTCYFSNRTRLRGVTVRYVMFRTDKPTLRTCSVFQTYAGKELSRAAVNAFAV